MTSSVCEGVAAPARGRPRRALVLAWALLLALLGADAGCAAPQREPEALNCRSPQWPEIVLAVRDYCSPELLRPPALDRTMSCNLLRTTFLDGGTCPALRRSGKGYAYAIPDFAADFEPAAGQGRWRLVQASGGF